MKIALSQAVELKNNIETIINRDDKETYLLVETIQLIQELENNLWNEIETRRIKQLEITN